MCDEWRDEADIVPLETDEKPVESFNLHSELARRIKQSLNCVRKETPIVRLDMPFDFVLYEGGLKARGYLARDYYRTERYKIHQYKDLNTLLSTNWHWRGLNVNGDFCYVILDTVEYYLYRRQPLKEYVPSEGGPLLQHRDLGYTLVFQSVRGDGTSSDFGTDSSIFG